MTPLGILKAARDGISTPEKWTKDSLARDAAGEPVRVLDANAVCWCAQGIVCKVSGVVIGVAETYTDAYRDARAMLRLCLHGGNLPEFIDDPATTHSDILALFGQAITKAEDAALPTPVTYLPALDAKFIEPNGRALATPKARMLPIKIGGCTREQLEEIGFIFGKAADASCITTLLPVGWEEKTGQQTANSLYSYLVDGKGRKRADIFFTDSVVSNRAGMTLHTRYGIDMYDDEAAVEGNTAVVTDCGVFVHALGTWYKGTDYALLKGQGEQWLDQRYPDWRNPFAYWD